jgi:hypothetical protein
MPSKEGLKMKHQPSPIKLFVWMTAVIAVGIFASHRALLAAQNPPVKTGYQDFQDRVEAYEKLHKVAEKSVPEIKKKDSPEAIVAHQEALVNKLRELRSSAHQGDIFTPSATVSIGHEIKAVYDGRDGRGVRRTIQSGEPLAAFKVEINQKYPNNLPITTVPPSLLLKLPRLPEEVDYRILGSTLLLVDRKANMIVDFIPDAIPQ